MSRKSRKSKRRINSLFMMLLLTAVLLIASTYAWFSANRQVQITDITARVAAAEGLQVSLDGVNWGSSVAVNETSLEAVKTANKFKWASRLEPVSADGTNDGSDLNFFYGDINASGSLIKEVATAAFTNANVSKYIAFDIYLKNSSSKAEDQIELAQGSSVTIHQQTEAEKALDDAASYLGQNNTGLEYSVRTGFIFYDNTAAFTQAQAGITGLSATDSATAQARTAIWEPNINNHIAEIVANDIRITDASQQFKTLTLNSSSVGKNIEGINLSDPTGAKAVTVDATTGNKATDSQEVAGTYMTETKTVATEGDTVGASTKMTSVTGADIKIKGNAITKARVYIWIEGQDPDCQDTASTGKAFDVLINLSKPAVQ